MQLFTNNATTKLDAPISAVGLSLQVKAGDGAMFPAPTGGDFFLLTLSKVNSGVESSIEIVRCTARAGDVLTIVRAQEGTTALVYAVEDYAQLRMTAATAASFEGHAYNTSNPHGTTKTQVGLGNVDNTADSAKPVSTAQATALGLKYDKTGGTVTGNVTVANGTDSRVILQVGGATEGQLLATAAQVRFSSSNAIPMVFGTNGVDRLTITGSGLITTGATDYVGIGAQAGTNNALRVARNLENGVNAYGVLSDGTFQAGVTTAGAQYRSVARTAAAAFTMASLQHFQAVQAALGAGSAITTQVGFAVDASLIGATNNYAFQGSIPAGANRYNLYLDGTADNFVAGNILGADAQLTRMMLKDTGHVYVDKGTSGTLAQVFDYTAGSHQKLTCTGAFSLTFSNWPTTGNTGFLMVEAANWGSASITFPTVNWVKPDGTTTTSFATYLTTLGSRPSLQSSGTDFFIFWSRDAGTTIYGKLV